LDGNDDEDIMNEGVGDHVLDTDNFNTGINFDDDDSAKEWQDGIAKAMWAKYQQDRIDVDDDNEMDSEGMTRKAMMRKAMTLSVKRNGVFADMDQQFIRLYLHECLHMFFFSMRFVFMFTFTSGGTST
jgi:hypothetical protein